MIGPRSGKGGHLLWIKRRAEVKADTSGRVQSGHDTGPWEKKWKGKGEEREENQVQQSREQRSKRAG